MLQYASQQAFAGVTAQDPEERHTLGARAAAMGARAAAIHAASPCSGKQFPPPSCAEMLTLLPHHTLTHGVLTCSLFVSLLFIALMAGDYDVFLSGIPCPSPVLLSV